MNKRVKAVVLGFYIVMGLIILATTGNLFLAILAVAALTWDGFRRADANAKAREEAERDIAEHSKWLGY